MTTTNLDPQTSLRQQLVAEHERFDRSFDELLAAFRANAQDDVRRLWNELDAGLSGHMDFEERAILPPFRLLHLREAEALLAEHERIRSLLTELGMGIDLHMIRAEVANDFVELLRSHARREDALMYHWVEQDLAEAARQVAEGRRAQEKPGSAPAQPTRKEPGRAL